MTDVVVTLPIAMDTSGVGPEGPGADGNNSTSSPARKKKKRASTAVSWAGTCNNYTEEHLKKFRLCLSGPDIAGFIYQCEIGEKGEIEDNEGTPHLQIHVEFVSRKRPMEYFKGIPIHWKAVRYLQKHRAYCQKDATRTDGPFIGGRCRRIRPLQYLQLEDFYPWQKHMYDLLQAEPDNRTVMWVWKERGSMGKTQFARHIVIKHHAIMVGGSTKDIFYAIQQYMELHGAAPEIVVVNVARNCQEKLAYEALEGLKDGVFFSTKFKSGMCVFNPPHVLVCANFEPELFRLSADRWWVREIKDDFTY